MIMIKWIDFDKNKFGFWYVIFNEEKAKTKELKRIKK